MALFNKHHSLIVCVWPDPSQDEVKAIDSYSTNMEKKGYQIKKAVSTPQGIELIAHTSPELILVYDDPSTVATLKEDRNFAGHYRPSLGAHMAGSLLFERVA